MSVLVIGGSVFLGRAVVAEARAQDVPVTVFNRGISGPAAEGVEHVKGDRTNPADLEQLTGRSFDLVIDTCGFEPADVARSAELLAPACKHYVFVSSINAYPGWPRAADYALDGVHDGNPDAARDDVPDGLSEAQAYGWLKVGCERAVQRAFGADRCSILRSGALAGPHDNEDRLPWWLDRVARGGEVLVPGPPEAPVALVDARDLARFAIRGVPGTFDTPGPERDTRADLMAACAAATGADVSFTYVTDEDWLVEQGVAFWTELPLWIPKSLGPSVFASHSAAARAAGLRWRPLSVTVADTWAWQRSIPGGWRPVEGPLGLEAERERVLLASWHDRAT